MSYQALARKWRPKSFREMVGQEHVLRALINALDHDRLHHAYLFTGTRGVGKTTIARILAKCLNCEEGVSSEPCGKCSSCVEIAEGRSVDLLEVDAASRTKVEDTRELLENVQYAPTRSRYKVYLIDEVHMLSNHSFNALLKTLEEPPPHVKFLLATTDPQKLPATILSRCLQFNLKNMPPDQVVSHLKQVLGQEMVSFEEPALWLLGRAAAGSMRDALSLTDQAIAYGSGDLKEVDVRNMLGTVDMSFIYQVLEAVVAADPAGLLEVVARMAEHAPDFESSLGELVSLLHRIAVAQAVPEAIDTSWGDAERVQALAQSMTGDDTQLYYQLALNGRRDIPHAADPRSGFEMTVLRMLAFRPAVVFDNAVADGTGTLAAPDTRPGAPAGEAGDSAKKPESVPAPVVMPEPVALEAGAPDRAREGAAPDSTLENTPETVVETASETVPARAPEIEPVVAVPRVVPTEPKIDFDAIVAVSREPEAANAAPSIASASSTASAAPAPVADASSAAPALTLAELTPSHWPQLLEALGVVGIVYNIAANSELREVADKRLAFVLDESNATLFNSGHSTKLRLALQNYFATELEVVIEPGPLAGETPAQRSVRLAAERQQRAIEEIESDPLLQQLIERFDGELDRASIAPVDTPLN